MDKRNGKEGEGDGLRNPSENSRKGNEIGHKLGFRRREEKTGAAKRRDDG